MIQLSKIATTNGQKWGDPGLGIADTTVHWPKEFFTDYLDQKDYIPDRRHTLRKRAGLREKDKRVPWYNLLLEPLGLWNGLFLKMSAVHSSHNSLSKVVPFSFVERLCKGDQIREVEVFCPN